MDTTRTLTRRTRSNPATTRRRTIFTRVGGAVFILALFFSSTADALYVSKAQLRFYPGYWKDSAIIDGELEDFPLSLDPATSIRIDLGKFSQTIAVSESVPCPN